MPALMPAKLAAVIAAAALNVTVLSTTLASNPVVDHGKANQTAQAIPTSFAPASPAAEVPSNAMTMKEMQSAITDLMLGKSAFGATPMGGSVKKIKNIITKDMFPKVLAAHKADQQILIKMAKEIAKCGSVKDASLRAAAVENKKFRRQSSSHKSCRNDEAVRKSSYTTCKSDEKAKYVLKKERCNSYTVLSRQLGTSKNNMEVVKKAGGESVQTYITRMSQTFCGRHVHGTRGTRSRKGGWGGGLVNGYLDRYLKAKYACEQATKVWKAKVRECKRKRHAYRKKKAQCNQYQGLMDNAACKTAVITKDACESYAGCYFNKLRLYKANERRVRAEVIDRKAEWRGLKRMECLIDAFADGKVTKEEISVCKKKTHPTGHLNIKYPKIPPLKKCVVPQSYPSTGTYRKQEFAPLPVLAKGYASSKCEGLDEVSLKARHGSPKACKCSRVSLNGPYSASSLVKCEKCLDVRKSTDRNSCPLGTKLFSPASRSDWKTFLTSAKPLRAPHFIIDITRPLNSCGGCTRNFMNSGNRQQKTWRTSDGTPWWLRSTRYNEPNGDYTANCYLNLWHNPKTSNDITFNDWRCKYHSKSYYCQGVTPHKPRPGSPKGCKCTQISLTGTYAAKELVKCEQCLLVSKATQKNSCPIGMKIFSPQSRRDWKTFLDSAGPLRAPHWIIDITRPQNGCGGCTRFPMRSTIPQQATWRTLDGSKWWLRNSRYNEPNGDYRANCFLDLWRTPQSENALQFNDWNCNYRSRSYYCQPKKKPREFMKKPKACKRPRGWCGHRGSGYNSKLDCDGDGVADPYCYDKKGNYGFIGSANGCQSNWPRKKCKAAMCARPSGWCGHKEAIYTTLHDCDGDGIKDPYCVDTKRGHYGFLPSKSVKCTHTWPKTKCGGTAVSLTNLRVGATVALWSKAQRHFVKIAGGTWLIKSPKANSPKLPGGWSFEKFVVVDAGGGKIALWNAHHKRMIKMSNHRYLMRSPHVGSAKLPGGWGAETFKVVDAGNNEVAFWNPHFKRFMRMPSGGNMDRSPYQKFGELPHNWSWERFTVVCVKGC
jgi:hypothetical protein